MPEPLAAQTEEDEDNETHPGVEDGEDWVEVPKLPARELYVGWVCEQPYHHKQEVGYCQPLPLHL